MKLPSLGFLALVLAAAGCSSSGTAGAPGLDAGSSSDSGGAEASLGDASDAGAASDDGGPTYPTFVCIPSSDAGDVDAASLDTATITTAVVGPSALTALAGTLYWVNAWGQANGAVESIPATGGAPMTVMASPGLGPDLAFDGTSIYFVSNTGGETGLTACMVGEAGACDQDAAAATTLIPPGQFVMDFAPNGFSDSGNQLFVVGGTVYLGAELGNASGGVVAVGALDGGSPSQLALPLASPAVVALAWADSSGLYTIDEVSGNDAPTNVYVSPLAGGQASLLQSVFFPEDLGITAIGGNAYLNDGDTIWRAPISTSADGGAAVPLVSYQGVGRVIAMVADANGMYVAFQSYTGCTTGIYSVSPATGATALVQADPSLNGQVSLALDSQYVYWSEGVNEGGNPAIGSWSLHAKAR